MTRRWLDPGFFTDEKLKRATVPERLLAAAIIAHQDDDGRLRGDPAYLRAIAFLYDNYTLDEVKAMRNHLTKVNPNIMVYEHTGDEYIQLRHHKRYQNPRYYHPSKLPSPPGWPFEEQLPSIDRIETNEPPISNHAVTNQHTKDRVGLGNNVDLDKGKDKGKGIERGRGALALPSASPISSALLDNFPKAFGRQPDSREMAYLRDIEKEISAADATAENVYDAYKEAAISNKLDLSYVRAILFDWLGIERNRSP
jgi:hypothetical protein